jgi:hypothetical protein
MNNRRHTLIRRPTTLSQWLLCWVLCLAAWRGPVPMMHAHSLAADAISSNPALVDHLARYHTHDEGTDEEDFHFHWALMSEFDSLACFETDGSDAQRSNSNGLSTCWVASHQCPLVEHQRIVDRFSIYGRLPSPIDWQRRPATQATRKLGGDTRSSFGSRFSGSAACSVLCVMQI